MIQLHCTKKLFTKLPLDAEGRLPDAMAPVVREAVNDGIYEGEAGTEPVSLLSGWHANLVVLQRRNCVLFVHDATRFPVFVPGLLKPDLAQLESHFVDVFMNTLLKVGATEDVMARAHHALGPLVCDTTVDRSVVSTLNQMVLDMEHWLYGVPVMEILPYSISARLAIRPTKVKARKDYIWPMDEMLALLR